MEVELSGKLIDDGIIELIDRKQIDDQEEIVKTFPSEIIHGMLKAKGIYIKPEDFISIINKAAVAEREIEDYESKTGKSEPNWGSYASSFIIRTIRKEKNIGVNQIPLGYNQEDLDFFNRKNDEIRPAIPIYEAFKEYNNLISYCQKYKRTILQTSRISDNNFFFTNEKAKEDVIKFKEVGLFRIVTNRLGKLSYRNTLEDTLKLSKDPTTEVLRKYLSKWVSEIVKENTSALDYIQNEISKASLAISKIEKEQKLKKTLGYFTAPVGLLEFLTTLPPLLSGTIELVGRFIDNRSIKVLEKNRWIMFGNM